MKHPLRAVRIDYSQECWAKRLFGKNRKYTEEDLPRTVRECISFFKRFEARNLTEETCRTIVQVLLDDRPDKARFWGQVLTQVFDDQIELGLFKKKIRRVTEQRFRKRVRTLLWKPGPDRIVKNSLWNGRGKQRPVLANALVF